MTKTTIQIDEKTRDKLRDLGKKGETYDEIINRLIGSKK
jgi:predicted CopG family antitoxin